MNAIARAFSVAIVILVLCDAGLAAPKKTVTLPRFVDIAATVENQVKGAITSTQSSGEARLETTVSKPAGIGEEKFFMLGIAVLLSTLSTVMILRIVATRPIRAVGAPSVLTGDDVRVAGRALSLPVPPTREEWTSALPRRIAGKTADEDLPVHDDQTFRLLQSFHRGHGELSLAMRLGSDTAGNRTREKLRRALPQVEGVEGLANVARKFGIGKGEIGLAVHLKEIQTSHLRKE